jgi:type VI secretion system VasI/ImpG family protein
MDLLDYYRDNLLYMRGLAAEFAKEFPKIAVRLGLSSFDCQDPYVERILEGTAFLAARVEKKLDEGYQNFLESILNSMSPISLYPIPSGAVLQLDLNYNNEDVHRGTRLPAGIIFDAPVPFINTPCRFAGSDAVPLVPFSINEAEYITRNLAVYGIKDQNAVSGLKIKFNSELVNNVPQFDELLIYIDLPEAEASNLQRQIMHDSLSFYIRYNGREQFIPAEGPYFDLSSGGGGKALYEKLKGNIKGLKLLQNFLAYPAFFKFFSIKNCTNIFNRNISELEMIVTFKRREQSLSSVIHASSLKLNCVPVLNFFPKRSDRIPITREAFEFHIVPDKTAMRDYEIISISKLEFFNELNETLFYALNFYNTDVLNGDNEKNFFNQHRRKSLFQDKSNQRSSYAGSEVFISFSSQNKNGENAYQFAADLICSNRDLPLLVSPDAALSSNSPLAQRAVFVSPPTQPDYSAVEHGNRSDFAKLSHIIFNLSSMLWLNGKTPLDMLKTMLRNYNVHSREETDRMIEGIIKLESEPATFRFIRNGSIFFEYGWRVSFTLDEDAYTGMGCYIFAYIIGEILKSFTPINSLLEVQFYSQQSGHIATWKTLED